MTIRVACIGGGPGGLFFSTLLRRQRPDIDVVLFERNQPTDAFGFGVVFSDRTLQRIDEADPTLHRALAEEGVHWDSIAVAAKGETHFFAGNGMAAVHRKVLLRFLQNAAAEAGVDLRFGHNVGSLDELDDFDLVIGADGTNSLVREALEPAFGSTVETATAKFIWFGTTYPFERLTFVHRRSEHGNFAAHAYPIGQGLSTFIVETDEATWRAAGLDGFDPRTPPGPSDEVSQDYLRRLFAEDIGGHPLVANNSRWANFRTRRTRQWSSGRVALLGDAVHTAHFSVGSGTKMAMEDAIVLAREVAAAPDDLTGALARYEEERKPEVAHIQDAAGPSLGWWEQFGRYHEAFDPLQFSFHFFSRSIDVERVRRRDPDLAAAIETRWLDDHGAPPLETPLAVGDVEFAGRDLVLRGTDGAAELTDAAGAVLSIGEGAARVCAPDDIHEALTIPLPDGAEAVLIEGGTPYSRTLVAERVRLDGGAIAVIADGDLSAAAAATLLLSGRADAVVRPESARAAG
jgi:2-polyprenyl-6-methoxyphenol hydroxylase-like FAD-dependent oxidoreductase